MPQSSSASLLIIKDDEDWQNYSHEKWHVQQSINELRIWASKWAAPLAEIDEFDFIQGDFARDKLIDEPRHPEGSNMSKVHQHVRHEERLELKIEKRRSSGNIDGLKVSAFTNIGAAQKDVSGDFSTARKLKRGLSGTIDGLKVSALADTGAAQNVVSSNFARARKLKRGLSGTIDGLKVSTLTDTGAAQNVVSSNFTRAQKLKRGLLGTINSLKVSALADTGAAQNVVSSNFARARKLDVAGPPSSFRLGNSRLAHSLVVTEAIIGTVNVRWAFADKPTETIEVICHVVSNCAYDVILGGRFLSMTETFTKYKHRLTKCLSSAAAVLLFNLLDESCQFLEGTLGDTYKTDAVPDTGAEGNVMDLRYAEEHGFNIKRAAENRRVLEFANGSRQRAVGQVETSWTFDSGQRIPLIFEVLEDCLHDVILGEEVLWEHDVFDTYAASIQTLPADTESFDLAPFSFVPKWVQKISGAIKPNRECKGHNTKPIDLNVLELEERRRRDFWNHQHNFNSENASQEEWDAERERRRQYEERLALARLTLEGRGPSAPESHVQSIPSIPTAPNTPH